MKEMRSLRYKNADALKNAVLEEGLGQVHGVRGGKIKLRILCDPRTKTRAVSLQ